MNDNDCILFNKVIYGLVQAMRKFYEKAIDILKKAGFSGGNVNPCLYMKKVSRVKYM